MYHASQMETLQALFESVAHLRRVNCVAVKGNRPPNDCVELANCLSSQRQHMMSLTIPVPSHPCSIKLTINPLITLHDHVDHTEGLELQLQVAACLNARPHESVAATAAAGTYGPLSGQVTSVMRQAVRRAVMEAGPCLVEAMSLCEVSATSDALAGARLCCCIPVTLDTR